MPNPLLAALALLVLSATPAAARPQSRDAVQAELWGKEQAIYTARGRGDMAPYIASIATDYKAWPPFRTAPAGVEGLNQLKRQLATANHEKLEMRFVDLALNGDSAVIYYQTHRTMLPDGTPANEVFDVTHSWVRENGVWKVLGGMARERKP